eukprot:scaffold11147_cov38-Phaeocystis_antarctica.AAC.2
MKNVGSASTTSKPVAHLLSCAKSQKRAGEAYGTGANLLASAFNLIVDTLPHKVKGYYDP